MPIIWKGPAREKCYSDIESSGFKRQGVFKGISKRQTEAFIVNEKAAEFIGKESPVGDPFRF